MSVLAQALFASYGAAVAPPDSVSWVAGTGVSLVASGTTVEQTTPAGIADDDCLIAFVFARSDITPPSGWTEVITSANFTGISLSQRIAAYRKDVVTSANSSTSYTFTQAASNRAGLCYAVARSTSGTVIVDDSASATVNNSNTYIIAPPYLTAEMDGELFLCAASTIIQLSSGTPVITQPSGMTLFTTPVPLLRLAAAYQTREQGQSNSGTWNMSTGSGTTDNGLGAITIRLQPG